MEWQLFEPGTIPEYCTPEWYAEREAAPHLEQPGQRERLLQAAELCERALAYGACNVVDLGAGDGGLLSLLPWGEIPRWGYDLQQSNADAALSNRDVGVDVLDVVAHPELVDWAELVLCTEMLEHLVDPHAFVRLIAAQPEVRYLVASSPYTETDQSHYGFHTWAWDLDGYRALFENNGWRVLEQRTAWISQCLLLSKL